MPSAGGACDVAGAIYYGELATYRPGQTVDVTFAATLPRNDEASGSNEHVPIAAPGLHFKLMSKEGVGPTRQVIEYDARPLRTDAIKGTYRSSRPFDAGTSS
jgi:hypothetical protein